jgi:hypothetical protein
VNIKTEVMLALNDALDRLAEHDARKAELVKLRYFVGAKIEEAAQGFSAPTAKPDCAYARALAVPGAEGRLSGKATPREMPVAI